MDKGSIARALLVLVALLIDRQVEVPDQVSQLSERVSSQRSPAQPSSALPMSDAAKLPKSARQSSALPAEK